MPASITYKGNELYGWRRTLAKVAIFTLAPIWIALGFMWMVVALVVIVPVGAAYRAVTGRWPSWCQIELSR